MPKDASEFAGLLPENFDEFRSVEFWDGFFKKRNNKAFEWYGEWPNFKTLAAGLCKGRSVLVPGCGNSELSAQMYDDGITSITNLDFSKPVIKEMMVKHLRSRPLMKWMVMDITDMKLPSGSFDVVMDKGALDALMGEDNQGAKEAGGRFLKEVSRVLSKAGVYLCITLAQSHVLDALLAHFAAGWNATLHKLPPPADMAGSPLQPYLAIISRNYSQATAVASGADVADVVLAGCIDASLHRGPDREQLADVQRAVAKHNKRRAAMRAGTLQADGSETAAQDFDALHPGRRVVLQLPQQPGSSGSKEGTDEGDSGKAGGGLFTATVCDAAKGAVGAGAADCMVFLVPQGREHEWLFSSAEGQWQVVESVGSRRVVLVAINRSVAQFDDLQALQSALSPLVTPLLPLSVRGMPKAVAYVTSGSGIGRRRVVEQAASELSGDVVVEDVEVSDDEDEDEAEGLEAEAQRLFQHLNLGASSSSGSGGDGGKPTTASGGKKQKAKKAAAKSGAQAGGQHWVRRLVFLAARGRIQSEAVLRAQEAQGGKAKPGAPMVPDPSHITCSYHAAMLAGMAATADRLVQHRASCSSSTESGAGSSSSGGNSLVIGMGGGGLPLLLHRCLGMQVDAVELDPVVVRMAQDHFGCAPAPGLAVIQGDGLQVVQDRLQRLQQQQQGAAGSNGSSEPSGSRPEAALDLLVVDADSGDARLAMSCPPPAFLAPPFLQAAAALVAPAGGLLAMNCVSRSPAAYQAAVDAVKAAFPHVFELAVDGDVNRVLLATHAPSPALQQALEAAAGQPLGEASATVLAQSVAGLAVKPFRGGGGLVKHAKAIRRL